MDDPQETRTMMSKTKLSLVNLMLVSSNCKATVDDDFVITVGKGGIIMYFDLSN